MTNKTKKSKWLKLALISTASLSTLATIPAAICAKASVKTSTPTVDTNLTLPSYHKLKFKLKDYDISTGATITGQTITKVKDGDIFGMVDKPTVYKKGCLFKGWVADSTSTEPIGDDAEISADMTVYALFVESTSIVVQGNKIVSLHEQNIKYEAIVTPKENAIKWYVCDDPDKPSAGSTHASISNEEGSEGVLTTKKLGTFYVFALFKDESVPTVIFPATSKNVLEVKIIDPSEDAQYADKILTTINTPGTTQYHTYAMDPEQFYSPIGYNIKGTEIGTGTETDLGTREDFDEPLIFGKNVTVVEDDFLPITMNGEGTAKIGFTSFDSEITFKNVTYIGDNFLKDNTNFNQALNFPTTLKHIGDGFLHGCTKFNKELTFAPEGATPTISYIGDHFMDGCSKFGQEDDTGGPVLKLPSSITKVGEHFMHNCTNAKKVYVDCSAYAFAESPASFAVDNTSGTATHNVTIAFSENTKGIYRELKQQFPDENGALARSLDLDWVEGSVACVEDTEGKLYFTNSLTGSKICDESGTGDITVGDTTWPRDSFDCKVYLNDDGTLTNIPNCFLRNCPLFNQPITIPNSITAIGENFLYGAKAFNQPLTIPSSITNENSIGKYFMWNAYNMTSVLTINCPANAFKESENTCAMNDRTVWAYKSGIPVAGTNAAAFMTRFPNTDDSLLRKLYPAPVTNDSNGNI